MVVIFMIMDGGGVMVCFAHSRYQPESRNKVDSLVVEVFPPEVGYLKPCSTIFFIVYSKICVVVMILGDCCEYLGLISIPYTLSFL
jgi:hypothetical protein